MDKELELLTSEKEVTVKGKQVIVKKISMLDSIRIASGLSGVVANVLKEDSAFGAALAKITYTPEKGEDDTVIKIMGLLEMIGLIGEDGVNIIKQIISKSTTLTNKEIEDLDLLEGTDLLFDIYEVNESFFEKCGKRLQERLNPKKAKK